MNKTIIAKVKKEIEKAEIRIKTDTRSMEEWKKVISVLEAKE
jgi:hypothetical protein